MRLIWKSGVFDIFDVKNMTIGELLKDERLAKAKTQKEWVGDIISTSYYAKVEKNKHRITAEELLALLRRNHIDSSDFFQRLENNQDLIHEQEQTWSHMATDAVYHHDIPTLKNIVQSIKDSELPQDKKEEDALEVEGMIETLRIDYEKDYQPNLELQQKLKERIFSIPNFTKLKLQLYCDFMGFYDLDANKQIIKQIIKETANTTDNQIMLAVSAIINNFISASMSANHYDGLDYYISIVEKMPQIPELYLIKSSIAVHKYLIEYHFEKDEKYIDYCQKIAESYQLTGMKDFGKNVAAFIEQEKKKADISKK